MRHGVFGRIVLALLALALFAFYAWCRLSVSAYSDDLGEPGQIYEPWTAVGMTPRPVLGFSPRFPDMTGSESVKTPAEAAEAAPAEQTVEAPAETPTEPTAEPEPTVDPDSPYGKALANAAALGLPQPPEIDVTEWQYVLVNGDHPLDPKEYEPANLVYLNMTGDDTDIRTAYDGNRQVVDEMIAQPLIDMVQACKAEGLPVYLSSGYRSYFIQQQNFERICRNNGISDGKNAEGNYITMPAGCSEHQSGLCCDITDRYYEIKNDFIAQVPTVQWLDEHCADYGFILRFPADKTNITHVMGESWHFRYVGQEAARYIMDNNLCLEEFLALYGVD